MSHDHSSQIFKIAYQGTKKPSFSRANEQLSRAFSSENLAETSQLFDKNEIWSHKFMVRNHSSIKNGPLFIYLKVFIIKI